MARVHLAPLLVLAGLALAWSFPLVLHLETHIPGAGAGDNLSFLWNLWWMRKALGSAGLEFFRTSHLCWPYGADLALHTYTALNAFIGSTLLAPLAIVAALNVLILVSLFLNAVGGYLVALGPYLTVFGVNTGLILPQALARFVPIVSNARIPGRAMVMVYLTVAVLVALAVSDARGRWSRSSVQHALLVLILIDYAAVPLPLFKPDRPSIYQRLANLPNGALLELPVGFRDGFGQAGYLDDRVLYYQTIHEKPIVGGFVARLPPQVKQGYLDVPVVGSLLRLSEGGSSDEVAIGDEDSRRAHATLARQGIGYVMLNRARAPAALIRYVEEVLPLTLIDREGERELYALRRP